MKDIAVKKLQSNKDDYELGIYISVYKYKQNVNISGAGNRTRAAWVKTRNPNH